jgi:hypothetical protein
MAILLLGVGLKTCGTFASQATHNTQLQPTTPPIPLAQENDVFLMSQFSQLGYQKNEI